MIYGTETTLTVSGSVVIAADNLPQSSQEAIPLWSYRIWENGVYYLSISDIMSLAGFLGVMVGISMAIYKIKLQNKKQ